MHRTALLYAIRNTGTSAIARRYAGDEDFSNIRAQVKLIFLLFCTKRVVRH